MNEDLIAPCGMNCALCVSYQFRENDLNKKGYHRRYCPGCIPRGKHCTFMSHHCERLKHGTIRFCYMCDLFPCNRLKALDKRYKNKYGMSMIDNLQFIQAHGINDFLVSQQATWQCPTCQKLKCCHLGICLSCELEDSKK